MRVAALLLLPLLAVAGCAYESKVPPVSVSTGGSSKEPEPANSLPLGSSVDEPLTGRRGNIDNTRVGPARPRSGAVAPSRAY